MINAKFIIKFNFLRMNINFNKLSFLRMNMDDKKKDSFIWSWYFTKL